MDPEDPHTRFVNKTVSLPVITYSSKSPNSSGIVESIFGRIKFQVIMCTGLLERQFNIPEYRAPSSLGESINVLVLFDFLLHQQNQAKVMKKSYPAKRMSDLLVEIAFLRTIMKWRY
jgi:hypothetical protein